MLCPLAVTPLATAPPLSPHLHGQASSARFTHVESPTRSLLWLASFTLKAVVKVHRIVAFVCASFLFMAE